MMIGVRFTVLVTVLSCTLLAEVAGNGVSLGPISATPQKPAAVTVSGSVFALSTGTFNLLNFQLTPVIPTAKYYFAGSKAANGAIITEADITKFPNEYGELFQLEAYISKSLGIILPSTDAITNYNYFGVWDDTQKVFIAWVLIPAGLSIPGPVVLGTFTTLAHLVAAGQITALDERRISIPNFTYDGEGPDAFFYVGTGNPSGNGRKVGDENGNIVDKLGMYNSANVIITLPDGTTINTINWLSVWCIMFGVDFGSFTFPAGPFNLPTYVAHAQVQKRTMNCEQLHPKLQVSWMIKQSSIMIELAGQIGNDDYMAFGHSGSNERPSMVGSDVVVVDFQRATPRAIDYALTAYSQCANGQGACPDTAVSGAQNNVVASEVSGTKMNGIIRVKYMRLLNTGDSSDKTFSTSGDQEVVWGIGPLNTQREAAKHTFRTSMSTKINFGRTPSQNCPAFVVSEEAALAKFQEQSIRADTATTFQADIGNSGSSQGYQAITGRPSWGIAWWINGMLIPRLRLKRGVSYTFEVAGGSDPSIPGSYHPFYITDDPIGGYQTKNATEKAKYKIYAGVDASNNPIAIGDLCEYSLKTTELDKVHTNIQSYQAAHERKCNAGPNRYSLSFTADENTPDILYYQCFTHINLGYIMDFSSSTSLTFSMVLISLMAVLTVALNGEV